jgi:acyl-coenzyme A synthetase/AMP-(fatty) acid ligase/aspartate/methionine/tyrosine aminotransferase
LDSILRLKHISRNNSKRIFLIDNIDNTELTFEQLENEASKIASNLLNLGLKKGDRIAIIMENSTSLVKLYFGCLFVGIVIVPINPTISLQEIDYVINHSNAKLIVTSEYTIPKINVKFYESKSIQTLTISTKNLQEFQTLFWNINDLSLNDNFEPFFNLSSNDELAIVYTSGTTSEPKAVVHNISSLVENAHEFGKIVGIDKNSRFYNMLSLTYLGGYYNLLLLPYVCESSVVLTHTYDPKSILNFWEPVIKNKVNTLWLVPSIISILLEFDRGNEGKNYCKQNIKFCLSGTAPLPYPIKLEFEEKYGIKIYENLGLTETFFISTSGPNQKNTKNYVGKILPSVNLQITKNNKKIKNFEEGDIEIKTPFLMRGYHNLKKENSDQLFNNNWFKTGDLGYTSDHNELFLTGRKKDLIIRSGINISPLSIENILYRDPSIRECAVIGIPHKFEGEEIVAVVSLKKDENFKTVKPRIIQLCKENLSTIKIPSKIIQLPELPHTSSGKIIKNKIKSWILQSSIKEIPSIEKINIKQFDENSQLLPSKIVENSIEALSIKYNTMVYELQEKGEDITVLSLGEAFFDIPLFSFEDLPYPKIYHYSNSKGILELRTKLSNYFSENYEVNFDPNSEIIITSGSKIAIYMSLMALLNPGDEVLIHEPAWVSFPEQVKLSHGVPIQIPYTESIFNFEKYVSKKTKLIIVNNPNNPTGRVFNLQEMSYLHELAKKYNLFILSDEAYSDFVINKDEFISFGHLDIERKHTILINSISKNFGISGWRLGYLITNKSLIEQILKINQHLITCPSTILEYYISKHFDEIISITKPQILNLINKRKNINEYLDSIDLKYLPGTATFYFFISIEPSNLSSEEFCFSLLRDYKISTAPGIGYGKTCDKFIRVAIGSESVERIKDGLNKIKTLIIETSSG